MEPVCRFCLLLRKDFFQRRAAMADQAGLRAIGFAFGTITAAVALAAFMTVAASSPA
jgi:hypothetical protein